MKIHANKNSIYFLYYQYYFNFIKILREDSNVGWLSAQRVSQQPVGLREQSSLIQPTFNRVKSTLKTDESNHVGLREQGSLIQRTFNTSEQNQLSIEDENGTPLKKIPSHGTSTMAEVLARANGLEQNAQLTASFRLKIPNLIAEDRNWQGDFQAYDPNQIIGGYMPYIPMPPLKPPHESFWRGLLLT